MGGEGYRKWRERVIDRILGIFFEEGVSPREAFDILDCLKDDVMDAGLVPSHPITGNEDSENGYACPAPSGSVDRSAAASATATRQPDGVPPADPQ